MILIFSLSLFGLFLIFQCIYIFVPLFSTKKNSNEIHCQSDQSVTILMPAFNEEKLIKHSLKGIIANNHPLTEAIIINDGSTDQTMSILNKELTLTQTTKKAKTNLNHEQIKAIYQSKRHPTIFVIDKANGGKADALNAGITYADHDLVVTLDADSILKTGSIQLMQDAFKDERVVAAGGTVHVGQGIRGITPNFKLTNLLRFQVLQYITAFFLHKRAQSNLGAITVISGAFGAFRREILIAVGGYRRTVGEDMDITIKIQRYVKTIFQKGQLIYVPEAICYTECPASLSDLFKQRIRWQKAFIDCMLTYRKSLFSRIRFFPSLYLLLDSFVLGTLNAFFMLMIPFMIVFSSINIIIPFTLLMVSFVIACYQSLAALIVSGRFGFCYQLSDYLRYFIFIPFEIFTYRLLGVLFVTSGSILYFFNKKDWYVSKRIGQIYIEEAVS